MINGLKKWRVQWLDINDMSATLIVSEIYAP